MSGLPSNLPSIAKARLPVAYEHAKTALATCTEIDECKDWADKAEALASYAKQAQDEGLRKMADRIQARAIRRCGQLLEEMKPRVNRHDSRKGSDPPPRHEAARSAGLSRDQKRTALRVARVPGEVFDAAVESDDPPTVTELAERGKLPAAGFDLGGRKPADVEAAAHALGWIRNLHNFANSHNARQVATGLLRGDKRIPEVKRQVREVAAWLVMFLNAIDKRSAK